MRLTARGDVDGARVVARDLSADDAHGDDDASARIGGALGWMQIASEPADLVDGLVPAAEGCGDCHTARGVPAPDLPAWSHEDAALIAVAGLVWQVRAPPPPGGDEALARVGEAWSIQDPDQRAEAVLLGCQGCHAR